MLDEHAQKLFDQKGAQCERLERLLRKRRFDSMRLLRKQATENQRLRAALMARMREDK